MDGEKGHSFPKKQKFDTVFGTAVPPEHAGERMSRVRLDLPHKPQRWQAHDQNKPVRSLSGSASQQLG